ncbi:MAG: hypothetical protein KKH20_03010 [Proteobacteria bacterium]|nr:hypothetical protein [Pseudomonadota bacterium]
MSLNKQADRIYRGECPIEEGALGNLLAGFGAEIVVGHPTFRNTDNIGKEISRGIAAAAEVYAKRKVAFIVTDGTYRIDTPDASTLNAALEAARKSFEQLKPEDRENILVAAVPYDGYRGDRTPGKGSALKLLFDEVALCFSMTKLILLDGDLRNDLKPWFQVFQHAQVKHQMQKGDKEFFITARYARHFVDASLTRFVVGPLTTLMGEYVPGGISGDIVLSAGAVQHERDAEWNEHRRRYGTDIATTFDNIADPKTEIYEMYLGAKLHDITDEAKLSVMPGEVIGSALGRILHYENQDGRVTRQIKEDIPLKRPETWGPEKTGIEFIDPGFTSIFDVDLKRKTLVDKFSQFKEPMEKVLKVDTFARIENAHSRLANISAKDSDTFEFMGMTRDLWIDILYQNIAFMISNRDTETVKLCLNYLYTAAFLEFCREKIMLLGAKTFGEVRKMQKSLGVPPEKALDFYRNEVDMVVEQMALDFYNGRRKILKYL